MGNIGLTDVQPGMVLRGDVVATGDRLLLKAGTELTGDHIRIFWMWGVVEIDVEGICQEDLTAKAAAELAPSDLAAVEARVQALFRHNDRRHPVIDDLVRLTRLRLIRRAGAKADGP
jgi:hypothetical protein